MIPVEVAAGARVTGPDLVDLAAFTVHADVDVGVEAREVQVLQYPLVLGHLQVQADRANDRLVDRPVACGDLHVPERYAVVELVRGRLLVREHSAGGACPTQLGGA
ncbi:hypothetical protein D3C85_1237350 [compost metagenome]